MKIRSRLALPMLLLAVPFAAPGAAGAAQPPAAAAAAQAAAQPESTTRHRGSFGGRSVDYTARVERIRVSDGPEGPAADLVAFSYVAAADAGAAAGAAAGTDGGEGDARRPVLFVFNGGPLSASIYLHLGALAPKRVAFPDDLEADPATFPLVDNPYTVLDVADLVFFDPAGTGYSRVAPGTAKDAYFSVAADARQTAQLIEAWSQRHGRLESPKYLLGESYGTLRAAATAHRLAVRERPLRVDGVFLLGQALNIIEYAQRHHNIISYVVSLPTLAATGWYHGRVDRGGRDFEAFLDEARAFARTTYLEALFRGADLPQAERERIATRLQALTGLPAATYLAHDLKVTKDEYRVELFKDRGLVLGAYDARYVGRPERPGQGAGFDPSGRVLPAFARGFAEYARDHLGIAGGFEYRMRSPDTGGLNDWGWGGNTSPFGDWPYMALVKEVMERNPAFRVVMAHGHYDTATTTGASDYAVAHSEWPRERVRSLYYQGGHMPYTIERSLEQLGRDLREFIAPR